MHRKQGTDILSIAIPRSEWRVTISFLLNYQIRNTCKGWRGVTECVTTRKRLTTLKPPTTAPFVFTSTAELPLAIGNCAKQFMVYKFIYLPFSVLLVMSCVKEFRINLHQHTRVA